MAVVKRARKLVNPGFKKFRKGSTEAKEYMAGLRAMRSKNAGKFTSVRKGKKLVKSKYRGTKHEMGGFLNSLDRQTTQKSTATKVKRRAKKMANRRRPNVGELVTISLGNPAKKKTSLKRKGNVIMRRKRRVARRNSGSVVANPRRRRYTTRRRNSGVRRMRRYGRRRNPNAFSSTAQSVGGVIGGATLTGIIAGILPPNLTQGLMGYAVLGIVAYAQGAIGGKVFKSNQIGESMQVGGFTVLVLKALGEFLPGLSVGLAPRGLGWLYMNAPMTVNPMGRPFMAYNQPSGLAPSNMAVVPSGAGMQGFSRGKIGFGR